jgi:hypothetical protein
MKRDFSLRGPICSEKRPSRKERRPAPFEMTSGGSCGNGECFLDYFFMGLGEFGFGLDAEATCAVKKLVQQLTQLCPAYPMAANAPRI